MLQPSYKSSHSSQVPGHLTAPPAKQPHCCSHPDTQGLCCFSSNRTFFSSIISLLISMTTERQWIPLQRYRAMKLCLGLMELNHWWRVQFKVHHYHPSLWGGEEQPLFCWQPRLQSRENYFTQHRKCFLWQQLWKCHSSCAQTVCSSIIKRAIELSFKEFTGSHLSWTKANAPIIPQCWVHITQILYWSQPLFPTEADSAWEQKYEAWHYF